VPKQFSSADVEAMAHELMRRFDVLTEEFLVPEESGQFSRSETALLRVLAEQESANMSDISAELGLALSSTTGVVDRLVERGMVERTRPENDRRCVKVALTRRGRRAFSILQRDRIRLGVGMLERLSAREQQTLLAIIRKATGGR
jgi:DNA-binding MarR family transcriptional regulator